MAIVLLSDQEGLVADRFGINSQLTTYYTEVDADGEIMPSHTLRIDLCPSFLGKSSISETEEH